MNQPSLKIVFKFRDHHQLSRCVAFYSVHVVSMMIFPLENNIRWWQPNVNFKDDYRFEPAPQKKDREQDVKLLTIRLL